MRRAYHSRFALQGTDREISASPGATSILSKNRRNDLIKNKRVYHRHEVGHYWIVDPIEETLAVHRWHTDGYVEILAADRGERVRAEPFEAIEFHVGMLFGEDDDEE